MPTATFTVKVTTDWDPLKPLTTTKLNQLYDNTQYCKDKIEAHLHNGSDGSALIEVGPNELRNGSFESGTTGWTIVTYTGGTVAVNTSNPLDGAKSLAFTSTVLANGGGDAVSDEYLPVTGGKEYALNGAIKASVANVSAKLETIWYDNTKTQISATTMYSSSNVPTALTAIGKSVAAPAAARWRRAKFTGGVPATGSAVGTIYFDGALACAGPGFVAASGAYNAGGVGSVKTGTSNSGTYAKVAEFRAPRAGVYAVSMDLNATSPDTAYGRIYLNGVAVGTERTTASTPPVNFTEDITVAFGDLVQIYVHTSGVENVTASLKLLEAAPIIPV